MVNTQLLAALWFTDLLLQKFVQDLHWCSCISGFCHVSLLGRVGLKPKLVETSKTSFVTFLVGVNSQIVGKLFLWFLGWLFEWYGKLLQSKMLQHCHRHCGLVKNLRACYVIQVYISVTNFLVHVLTWNFQEIQGICVKAGLQIDFLCSYQ